MLPTLSFVVEPTREFAAETGPVVRLFDAITDDSGSAFGQMRAVLLGALGIGFLTTAGFVGATWHNRHVGRGPGA